MGGWAYFYGYLQKTTDIKNRDRKFHNKSVNDDFYNFSYFFADPYFRNFVAEHPFLVDLLIIIVTEHPFWSILHGTVQISASRLILDGFPRDSRFCLG